MIQVDNIDDVGLAYDLILKHQIPIASTLGRHSNDEMISFYIESPSGFLLEYGFGGGVAKAQSEYNIADAWGHEYRRL
jgi:extradiol dioxygenase